MVSVGHIMEIHPNLLLANDLLDFHADARPRTVFSRLRKKVAPLHNNRAIFVVSVRRYFYD